MLPAICAGPWWWTKLSPPSASNAAATTYSCSAVRGAVGACVAAGRRGCVSRQGTWGSSCAGHAATGPMVTAATADASAVRSVGLYCRSPVVSRARCLQAAIHATGPQFVTSGPALSAPSLSLCCTVVAVSSGGPCCSASGSCPGGRAGGTGCGKSCAPRRSGRVWYGFCRRCSGAALGWKRSCCRYQWPSAVRCCARRVPAVSPSLFAPLARPLATPCPFRGFVALYPFLYPSPRHALFPCLCFVVCLGLFPCRPGLSPLNLRRERV